VIFKGFNKIPRLSRDIVVTEKIDGTNAQVYIEESVTRTAHDQSILIAEINNYSIYAGSRTRWITPEDDNYGFAKWVRANAEELVKLGPGSHFGEWWGQGIQRKYGLAERRFSLFNVAKWGEARPACCHVVPVLYIGAFETYLIEAAIIKLKLAGSAAAPGFMKPEGVVIYHTASGHLYKKTCEDDKKRKGQSGA
jgi:RNA ligase